MVGDGKMTYQNNISGDGLKKPFWWVWCKLLKYDQLYVHVYQFIHYIIYIHTTICCRFDFRGNCSSGAPAELLEMLMEKLDLNCHQPILIGCWKRHIDENDRQPNTSFVAVAGWELANCMCLFYFWWSMIRHMTLVSGLLSVLIGAQVCWLWAASFKFQKCYAVLNWYHSL